LRIRCIVALSHERSIEGHRATIDARLAIGDSRDATARARECATRATAANEGRASRDRGQRFETETRVGTRRKSE
jgi:hypothetical protein